MAKKLLNVSIPSMDASVEELSAFLEKADWKTAEQARESLLESFEFPHGEDEIALLGMINARLMRLELPVLSKKFMNSHADEILLVDDCISAEALKELVYRRHRQAKPRYLVERGGQFRGIALAEDLIMVGLTAGCVPARELAETAQGLGVRLLNRDDSIFVEVNISYLVKMMEAIGVPALDEHSRWVVDSMSRVYEKLYRTYDLAHYNRRSFIGDDDLVPLLAKL